MIKKGLLLIILIMGSLYAAAGQQLQKSQKISAITFQDLKPKINYSSSASFYQPLREKEGLALLSSAVIPGTAQAANGKWVRAGAYLLAEALLIGVHINSYRDAKTGHRRYKKFADNNWSVVSYAKWLVDYHQQNNLTNPYIAQLEREVSATTASFDPHTDWAKVDIKLLRNVERNTPFVFTNKTGNYFSHVMPDYGSQQYYELISKYYQFAGGWNDFGRNREGHSLDSRYQLSWDGTDMPFNFFRGSDLAEDYNDSYRLAGNMLSLLVLNHVVSAFDAFLTVKLKKSRIKARTNFLNPYRTFSFKYHF